MTLLYKGLWCTLNTHIHCTHSHFSEQVDLWTVFTRTAVIPQFFIVLLTSIATKSSRNYGPLFSLPWSIFTSIYNISMKYKIPMILNTTFQIWCPMAALLLMSLLCTRIGWYRFECKFSCLLPIWLCISDDIICDWIFSFVFNTQII
jgi:hypothetical protein